MWSISVVNAAVAVFIVIAGYNIMIARQIGADYYELMEFLPRLALAVLAANFSLFFIRLFIDLENALNLDVINLFSLTILSNTITGIFHGNLLGAGLLAFVLAIILGVMDLLLAWQMLLRLALLILLIVLAPLAFLCGALPQTQGYLRLWLSTFAATVFIQFFQVSALAIGGTLISYVTAANLFNLGGSLLSIITSSAVLYLVLRIPGMLRIWALRPVAEAGPAAVRAAQGTVESAVGTGLRLMALLVGRRSQHTSCPNSFAAVGGVLLIGTTVVLLFTALFSGQMASYSGGVCVPGTATSTASISHRPQRRLLREESPATRHPETAAA